MTSIRAWHCFLCSIAFVRLPFTTGHSRPNFRDHLGDLQSSGGGGSRERFLLPILVYGPSNQVVGMKEGIMYAKLLGRTAVLPNIYEHYSQLTPTAGEAAVTAEQSWAFEDLFDVEAIAHFTKATTLNSLIAAGWDRHLDALLFWTRKPEFVFLQRLQTHNISAAGTFNVSYKGRPVCEADGIAEIKRLMEGHRVVGLVVYNRLVRRANKNVLENRTVDTAGHLCYNAYRGVSAHLVKAGRIRALAALFMQQHLHSRPFVALHVRPYPDTCLEVWKRGGVPTAEACKNPQLHLQVGPLTALAVRQMGGRRATAVYVASHPAIRPMVDRLLQAQGLRATYLDPALLSLPPDVGDTFGPPPRHSLTYDMFVEQEVALHSAIFIGTEESTITGIIRQQRTATDVLVNMSRVFTSDVPAAHRL